MSSTSSSLRDLPSTLTRREQTATLRPLNQRRPMNRHKRRALESHSALLRAGHDFIHFVTHCRRRVVEEEDDEEWEKPQYTLRAVQRLYKPSWIQRLCLREVVEVEHENTWDINALISSYLSFSHRTSYFLLFVVFSMVYYANILVFAFVYWVFSLYVPECVTSAGKEIGEGDVWNDSFMLSWTTFSTVGYGSIYPSTGANLSSLPKRCMFIGLLGSMEAFVGVLYAGFCTAVLFGKVIRSQSRAQIYFSDPMVVRFGKGELCDDNEKGIDVELGDGLGGIREESGEEHLPCPSLEFRLVNRLHDDVQGGEIVEAKLDCVAILDTKMSNTGSIGSSDHLGANNIMHLTTPQASDNSTENSETADGGSTNHSGRSSHAHKHQHIAIFHDPNSKQPLTSTKLTLDVNEHPFFRRVWFGRHSLDQNSPLLTSAARDKIKRNGGYWPVEWNNHWSIRENLNFRHILVCFSGTSNANAASVYAQKIYDLVDVNVGYRFVPMNYHTAEGELKTDSFLLNAISEQRGGGAEPLL